MTISTHLQRGGLSLAVTGLVAAAMTTGSGHGAMAMTHDLAMQKLAYSSLLGASTSSDPTPVTTPVTGALTITASIQGTSGVPSLVAPGYHAITVAQKGKAQRQLNLVKLNAGYTLEQLKKDAKVAGGDDEKAQRAFVHLVKNVEAHGGPGLQKSLVAPSTRGKTVKVSWTTDLTPGTYVFDNADEDDAEHTFDTVFTVPSGAPVGAKPSVAGTFKPHEYDFGIPSGLKPGRHTYAFKDSGQQGHIDVLAKVPAGTTADDVAAVLQSDGPPPAGFVVDADLSGLITKGQTVYRTLDFSKGTYVLICFLPEQSKKNAPPHFAEGMIKVFTVS